MLTQQLTCGCLFIIYFFVFGFPESEDSKIAEDAAKFLYELGNTYSHAAQPEDKPETPEKSEKSKKSTPEVHLDNESNGGAKPKAISAKVKSAAKVEKKTVGVVSKKVKNPPRDSIKRGRDDLPHVAINPKPKKNPPSKNQGKKTSGVREDERTEKIQKTKAKPKLNPKPKPKPKDSPKSPSARPKSPKPRTPTKLDPKKPKGGKPLLRRQAKKNKKNVVVEPDGEDDAVRVGKRIPKPSSRLLEGGSHIAILSRGPFEPLGKIKKGVKVSRVDATGEGSKSGEKGEKREKGGEKGERKGKGVELGGDEEKYFWSESSSSSSMKGGMSLSPACK